MRGCGSQAGLQQLSKGHVGQFNQCKGAGEGGGEGEAVYCPCGVMQDFGLPFLATCSNLFHLLLLIFSSQV